MDVALRLETLYHEIMLEQCKTEEARQWENARHTLMTESIRETIDYYARYYYTNAIIEERER